jgi:hypothetical protein
MIPAKPVSIMIEKDDMSSHRHLHEGLLPTIYSVYRPIEEYVELLDVSGVRSAERLRRLQPLDCLLVHSLLDFCTTPPLVIDLAAGDTLGASSLLCLMHVRPRAVLVPELGSGGGSEVPWQRVFQQYLKTHATDAAAKLAAQREDVTAEGTVFLIGTSPNLPTAVAQCFAKNKRGIVVIMGLGKTGACPALAELLSACGPSSSRRIALVREMGETLTSSALGLVYDKANTVVEEMAFRLRGLYASNFALLELLKTTCRLSLRMQETEAEITALRQGPAAPLACLDPSCQLAAALVHRTHELFPFKQLRNGAASYLMRAFRVWRSNGTRALLSKISKKLLL